MMVEVDLAQMDMSDRLKDIVSNKNSLLVPLSSQLIDLLNVYELDETCIYESDLDGIHYVYEAFTIYDIKCYRVFYDIIFKRHDVNGWSIGKETSLKKLKICLSNVKEVLNLALSEKNNFYSKRYHFIFPYISQKDKAIMKLKL